VFAHQVSLSIAPRGRILRARGAAIRRRRGIMAADG